MPEEIPPANTETPPANPPAPPVTPPTPPAQPPANPAANGEPSFREVMANLNSMPEKLVDAMREAFQQNAPKAPETPKETKTETAKAETPPAETKVTPGKKSFSAWWFGG